MGEVGETSKSVFRAIIYAPETCLDCLYVAPFRNYSSSKATGVGNHRQISHFMTPVKIRGVIYEMFECHFVAIPRT